MLGRLLSIVMAIALLCGGALSPAIAHARDAGGEHSAEVLQLDKASWTRDSQPGDESGKSDQADMHHHCTIAVEADAPAVEPVAPVVRATVIPPLSRILGSFAQAPPIEPPSA